MNSVSSIEIDSYHRTNLILWGGILSGIIIFIFIILVFDQVKSIKSFEIPAYIEKYLFLIAIAFALLIIIMKRSVFLPTNLTNSIKNTAIIDKREILFKKMRRNYIIIWSLAESIFIIGLVDYIFFVRFDSFLIYAIVSIYSLIINIPRKSSIEKSLELLKADL